MTHIQARCWQGPTLEHPGEFGHDAVLANLSVGPNATSRFVFHADDFPHGPTTIRILATDNGRLKDLYELQLYNEGGIAWREGLPDTAPPAAAGMRLVFADDFDGPLSISSSGRDARYAAHKTGGGDFSGWPFSSPNGENNPFGQRGTWLRIHASKSDGTSGRTGILSSIRSDGTGVCVSAPAYFECRFVAHSAPGTWPAFWTLTRGTIGMSQRNPDYATIAAMGTDEHDAVECYGGYGSGNPNHGGRYGVATHFWNQEDSLPDWTRETLPNGAWNPDYIPLGHWQDTRDYSGGSEWSWTAHDYGVAITETDVVYYLDGVEVHRHPTGAVALAQPSWFLIDYAIGGISGWPIDLERYGNESDMWVDWVRVYSGR